MKTAYIFPGQGAQFVGMGKDLFQANLANKALFEQANTILGFDITKFMFDGTSEDLQQTKVTQPAIFLHSVIGAFSLGENFKPDFVSGHSLGEFSALVAAKSISFNDGLKLVSERALAMQAACELEPSVMAAVLGLEDAIVEKICSRIPGIVVPANYNCPGQLVISGNMEAVNKACEELKNAGAKRALLLPVGGAFHSPLMQPAREKLATAIAKCDFTTPICPIYQNVNALPSTDTELIKENLVAQLTAPVRWTQTIQNMMNAGVSHYIEIGPGKVLQGLVKKIYPEAEVSSGLLPL